MRTIQDGFTQEQWELIDRMSAECDERNRKWIDANRHLPCEECGTPAGVDFYPTGGLARLTPLCAPCEQQMAAHTKSWHDGYNTGLLHAKQRSWWKRLFQ